MAFFIALLVVLIRKMSGTNNTDTTNANQNNRTVNPYSQNANTATPQQNRVNVNVQNTANVNKTQTTVTNNQVNKTVNNQAPVYKEAPKPAKVSTGDPEIDKMIDDRDKAIQEMHRLNKNIEDPKLSDQIDHLEDVTNKIMKYIIAHPKKKKQVSKFFNFYLPTTLKLLNSYDRMDETGISGTNIDGTKGKVEDMMDMALSAFDKQLDALFADEALDVSTDISVMANMLRAEGLTDDELMQEAIAAAKTISDEKTDSIEDYFAGMGTGSFGEEVQTSND